MSTELGFQICFNCTRRDTSGIANVYNYAASSPVKYGDPFGLTVTVDPSILSEYETVKSGLSQTIPEVKELFKQLDGSGSTYKVVGTPEPGRTKAMGSYFNPWTHTVYWDPTQGFGGYKGFGKLSPATILIHELTHAQSWDSNFVKHLWLNYRVDNDYDNLQEKMVITGIEGRVSSSLKQGIRFNHNTGNFCVVNSVWAIK